MLCVYLNLLARTTCRQIIPFFCQSPARNVLRFPSPDSIAFICVCYLFLFIIHPIPYPFPKLLFKISIFFNSKLLCSPLLDTLICDIFITVNAEQGASMYLFHARRMNTYLYELRRSVNGKRDHPMGDSHGNDCWTCRCTDVSD